MHLLMVLMLNVGKYCAQTHLPMINRGLSGYLDKHAERHAKNWGCVWNRDIDDIIKSAGLLLEKVDTWHFGTTYYIVSRPSKI